LSSTPPSAVGASPAFDLNGAGRSAEARPPGEVWLAGVDGCRAGWVVALVRSGGFEARVRVVARFADIVASPEQPAIVAVDVPIGLSESSGYGGRAAENAVRPLLGARRSSVFSVPSRAAIYAEDYREACRIAAATSTPPRRVSRQLFMIAPKIREVDGLLRAESEFARRVYECHPEVAFWRLNGEQALSEPKRVKSRPHAPGLAMRRALLIRAGLPAGAVEAEPPAGANADDLVDALACAMVACRIHARLARCFPDPVERDAHGLPMAIWA
jgi:predicted RNase H-like nuclease